MAFRRRRRGGRGRKGFVRRGRSGFKKRGRRRGGAIRIGYRM